MNILRSFVQRLGAVLAANKVCYLSCFLLFLVAFFFGLAAPVTMEPATASAYQSYLQQYFSVLPSSGIDHSAELLRAVLMNGTLLVVILFSGLHMLGLPLIVAALFCKALAIGFTVGFLFQLQSFTAVLQMLALLLPQNIIFIPLFLVAAAESCRFSVQLWKTNGPIFSAKRPYLARYGRFSLWVLGFCVLGVFAQSYIGPALLNIGNYLVP